MKLAVILGTRPNFIKYYAFRRACRRHDVEDISIHTGQHYDKPMYEALFRELGMEAPQYLNDLAKSSPAEELGAMMQFVEQVLWQEKPDATVVFGDVNSTMAGALASSKLGIPVAHVECGVRTHDRRNPEENNRRVTEATADTFLAHIQDAYDILVNTGHRVEDVFLTGDIVKDSLLLVIENNDIPVTNKGHVVVTIHRVENTDNLERIRTICDQLRASPKPILFPVHPRTHKALDRFGLLQGLEREPHIELLPPQSYVSMVRRLAGADRVISDSGGLRREAYILGKPAISLTNMIWVPAMVECGWELVADADPDKIEFGLTDFAPPEDHPEIFGDGHAADRILEVLSERYGKAANVAREDSVGIANVDSQLSHDMRKRHENIEPIVKSGIFRETVSLVIPCYNEEDGLPTLFYRLDGLKKLIDHQRYKLEYVLVDDGSTDQSREMLRDKGSKDPNVQVVHNEKNLGYGGALKRGIEASTGDIVITVDADTNYDLRESPRLLAQLEDNIDVVTGSPFMPGGRWNYPMHRFVFSRGVVFLYRAILRHRAQDISTFTCGFRAYRRRALLTILPESDDFIATAELLVRTLLAGYRVRQMPTVIFDRLHGQSKLRTLRTITSHLTFMWRLYRGEVRPVKVESKSSSRAS